MLKIFNERVYGLEESVIASGYPMRTDDISAVPMAEIVLDDKAFDRAAKLGTVPTGTGHDNFLKGIIVQCDVKYPNYWTPQFQRYSFHDIISSTSKMHRLTSTDIEANVNKYVDKEVIEVVNKWVDAYNCFGKDGFKAVPGKEPIRAKHHVFVLEIFNVGSDKIELMYIADGTEVEARNAGRGIGIVSKITKLTKYEAFMKVTANCPLGFEQTMRITTNYLQLKTIYLQRRHHKLREDWGAFCDFCLSLPYFKEFCLKGDDK